MNVQESVSNQSIEICSRGFRSGPPSVIGYFHACLQIIVPERYRPVLVIGLKEFAVVKECKHPRKVRFLFRDDLYEFLRCEGCGQILRLPV